MKENNKKKNSHTHTRESEIQFHHFCQGSIKKRDMLQGLYATVKIKNFQLNNATPITIHHTIYNRIIINLSQVQHKNTMNNILIDLKITKFTNSNDRNKNRFLFTNPQ